MDIDIKDVLFIVFVVVTAIGLITIGSGKLTAMETGLVGGGLVVLAGIFILYPRIMYKIGGEDKYDDMGAQTSGGEVVGSPNHIPNYITEEEGENIRRLMKEHHGQSNWTILSDNANPEEAAVAEGIEKLEEQVEHLQSKLDYLQHTPPLDEDITFEEGVMEFLSTFCVMEEDAHTPQKYIGYKYEEFCEENGIPEKRYKMYDLLQEITPEWVYRNEEHHREWFGLRLKTTTDRWQESQFLRKHFKVDITKDEGAGLIPINDDKSGSYNLIDNSSLCSLAEDYPQEWKIVSEWIDLYPGPRFRLELRNAGSKAARGQKMANKLLANAGGIVARGDSMGMVLKVKEGRDQKFYGFFPGDDDGNVGEELGLFE